MAIVLGRKPGGGGGPAGGVTSLSVSGDPALTGAVTLSEGTGIDVSQVGQDIAITQAALVWTNVTGGIGFQNGWSDLGAPYGLVAYAKDLNFVYLRGLAQGAAANVGFTLPAGFRPAAQRLFYFVGAAAAGGIEIPTTGAVTGFGGIPATVSFDSVSFSL